MTEHQALIDLARASSHRPVYYRAYKACVQLAGTEGQITTRLVSKMIGQSPFYTTKILQTLCRIGLLHEPQLQCELGARSSLWQMVTLDHPKPDPVRLEKRVIDGQEVMVKVCPTRYAAGALYWKQRLARNGQQT